MVRRIAIALYVRALEAVLDVLEVALRYLPDDDDDDARHSPWSD